ncbi:MAG: PilZ domain-containing protein [Desulfobacterales bacterium]|nr:PilZ domain-containing protein [Desulfobacterales bacterium]
MKSSILSPTERWDEHIKKLQIIESEMQQTEVFLESVMEKRASPRIRSLLLASYVPRKDEQQEYIISIGRTLDVSEGGAKIETHRQLDKGLQLELEIAVEDQIISAKGVVLYSQELGDGLFGTGISFTAINEEARRLLRS